MSLISMQSFVATRPQHLTHTYSRMMLCLRGSESIGLEYFSRLTSLQITFWKNAPLHRASLSVRAQQDPPDIPKEEGARRGNVEWLQTILSRFGPMTDRPQNQFVLDFEKPLVELDNRIREVRILPWCLCRPTCYLPFFPFCSCLCMIYK